VTFNQNVGATRFIVSDAGYVGSVTTNTAIQIEALGNVVLAASLGVGRTPGANIEAYSTAASVTIQAAGDNDDIYGAVRALSDVTGNSVTIRAFGSAYVGSLDSIDYADMGMLDFASATNAVIATTTSAPIYILTNNTKAITISTAQAVTCASTVSATQLISTIAIGTAPLVVTSTTVCANLNADLWDGYQFADYLNQAVKTTSGPTFAGVTSAVYYSGTAVSADSWSFGKTDANYFDINFYNMGGVYQPVFRCKDDGTAICNTMLIDHIKEATGSNGILLDHAVTCASTLQATGLSVGRALSAGYKLDVYNATAAEYAAMLIQGNTCQVEFGCGNSGVGASWVDKVFINASNNSAGFHLSTAGQFVLQTNGSTTAITVSTAQAVTCASTLTATDLYNSVAWTDYFASSTITGWAASPTGNIYYKRIGKTVVVSFYITGTSDAATAKFTLPVAAHASYPTYYTWAIRAVDNGTAQATSGMARLSPAGSTTLVECVLAWNSNPATGDFTTSGTKQIMGTLVYEAAS
jgi:hypothetical protein